MLWLNLHHRIPLVAGAVIYILEYWNKSYKTSIEISIIFSANLIMPFKFWFKLHHCFLSSLDKMNNMVK